MKFGTVERSHEKYRVRYRINGRQVRWPAVFETPSAAETFRMEMAVAHRKGRLEDFIRAHGGTPEVPVAPVETVATWSEKWLEKREDRVITVEDERRWLTKHALPRIGSMPIADVRPRHITELVIALRNETELAPRSIHQVFRTLHRMFKSAVTNEVIPGNPVMVEPGVLPKNKDKDPKWRTSGAGAPFTREETVRLISEHTIPPRRRVLYALQGLAGLRHGEAAGRRWADYGAKTEATPLGRLVVATSYDNEQTKTEVTRVVPVHPTLAAILDEWKKTGWQKEYGREPKPNDFIICTENMTPIAAETANKYIRIDLKNLKMPHRGGHRLRKTFISLAQQDGANRDVIRSITHTSQRDILDVYTAFTFEARALELLKLRVYLPGTEPTSEPRQATRDRRQRRQHTQLSHRRATGAKRRATTTANLA